MKLFSWKGWLALVVCVLLFGLIEMPARVLSAVLGSQTGGRFQLRATQGSLWHGQGQPALGDAALAERMSWDWQAKALLKGKLAFKLEVDGGQAMLNLGFGSIDLQDMDISVAAAPLFSLDQRSVAYGLNGQLRLAAAAFHWQAGKPAGQLTLDWRNATSSLVPNLNPLGNYRLLLTPAGDKWQIQTSTLDGALQLNGTGEWRDAQGLDIDLGLRAAQGAEAGLAPFLNQIGPGTPSAERRLKFNFR